MDEKLLEQGLGKHSVILYTFYRPQNFTNGNTLIQAMASLNGGPYEMKIMQSLYSSYPTWGQVGNRTLFAPTDSAWNGAFGAVRLECNVSLGLFTY